MKPRTLEIEALSFSVGSHVILEDLSFRVEPGQVFSILGPNGAGKSTLLRSISGILQSWSGKISFEGREQKKTEVRIWSQDVTYVGSHLNLEFPLQVKDVIQMGRNALGLQSESQQDREETKEVLALFECDLISERWVSTLSEGEKQRVSIARALIQGARVICLDESLSQLDLHHQATMGGALKKLAAQGKTFLLVSHDLNFATEYSDQCLFLKDGKRIVQGSPGEVFNMNTLQKLYPGARITFGKHPVSGLSKVYFGSSSVNDKT